MSAKSPGLEAELRARIAASGPLGFDEFMAAALYDPRNGYYASENSRTGKRGDYFTSVSVGPVFGRLLAAQFAQMWRELGRPENFALVEQGANDGQLMDDIFAAIDRDHPGFHPRVLIVEPLATRRVVQERTLLRWRERVEWVAHEKDLPDFTGVFFANELLDAFPVKLLVRRGTKWRERRVALAGEKFVFEETPVSHPVTIEATARFPAGENEEPFGTEWCPSLAAWLATVANRLQRGWIFLIDYGHPRHVRFHPSRAQGTLAAYRNHRRAEDPLADPGQQDLTAHVDFTAVAEAAEFSGLQIAGFADQHHALTALAAKVFPPMAENKLAPEAAREMRALRQLLHPESMGTSFKFLALSKGCAVPLDSFSFARDPQHELFI